MKLFFMILLVMLFVVVFGGWATTQAQAVEQIVIDGATPTPLCPEPDAVWHYFQRGYDAPQCALSKLPFNIAQDDATDEPTPEPTEVVDIVDTSTPVVESTPDVVIVETPPSDAPFSWGDMSFKVLLLFAMIMLGFSHPPQAGKLWKGLIEQVQQYTKSTPTPLDDTAFEIAHPAIEQIQARLDKLDQALASVNPPEGTAKG